MVALAVVIATVAAFLVSGAYYAIAPDASPPDLAPERTNGALVLVELLRNFAVAALVAGLLAAAEWRSLGAGLFLGLSLSIVPVVLLAGSVFHEGVPIRRATLHGFDWLIKLLAIGAITGSII